MNPKARAAESAPSAHFLAERMGILLSLKDSSIVSVRPEKLCVSPPATEKEPPGRLFRYAKTRRKSGNRGLSPEVFRPSFIALTEENGDVVKELHHRDEGGGHVGECRGIQHFAHAPFLGVANEGLSNEDVLGAVAGVKLHRQRHHLECDRRREEEDAQRQKVQRLKEESGQQQQRSDARSEIDHR